MRERLGTELNIGMMYLRASPNCTACVVLPSCLRCGFRGAALEHNLSPGASLPISQSLSPRLFSLPFVSFMERYFHEMVDTPEFATSQHEWDQASARAETLLEDPFLVPPALRLPLLEQPGTADVQRALGKPALSSPRNELTNQITPTLQGRFNRMVHDGEAEGPAGAPWVWGYNGSLRVHVLDNRLFADGCGLLTDRGDALSHTASPVPIPAALRARGH